MTDYTTLEGFERYYARGQRPSVILLYEMIANTKGNLIGHLAAILHRNKDPKNGLL
jgi:hypothetical protein